MTDSILVAKASRWANRGDGVAVKVRRGRTTAQAGHPIVEAYPDLWEPVQVDYPAAPADAAPAMKPADVRAWAREQGIDVPARGKLPDEVIAAYQAAQQE